MKMKMKVNGEERDVAHLLAPARSARGSGAEGSRGRALLSRRGDEDVRMLREGLGATRDLARRAAHDAQVHFARLEHRAQHVAYSQA